MKPSQRENHPKPAEGIGGVTTEHFQPILSVSISQYFTQGLPMQGRRPSMTTHPLIRDPGHFLLCLQLLHRDGARPASSTLPFYPEVLCEFLLIGVFRTFKFNISVGVIGFNPAILFFGLFPLFFISLFPISCVPVDYFKHF